MRSASSHSYNQFRAAALAGYETETRRRIDEGEEFECENVQWVGLFDNMVGHALASTRSSTNPASLLKWRSLSQW